MMLQLLFVVNIFFSQILGAVAIGLVADMGSYQAQAVLSGNEFTVAAFISFGECTALMMISYGCLMTTFIMLISSLLSFRTFHHVPKSLFVSSTCRYDKSANNIKEN